MEQLSVEETQTIQIPEDVRRILSTNYEIPQFSDEEDDPVDELTLDTIQKPIIASTVDVPEQEK